HLQLAAIQAQQAAVMGQTEYAQAKDQLVQSKKSLNLSRAGNMPAPEKAGGGGGGFAAGFDASLNEIACQEQVLEWANPVDFRKAAEKSNRNPTSETEAISV